MKANMTNSQYNGQYIEYSRPGFPNPRKISHFKNGRNHGNQITFYENLAKVPLIKSNVQYIEGRLHGVDQEYQIYTNHANKVNSKSEVYLSKESYYSEGYLDGFSRRWGLNIVKNQTYLLEEIKFKRGNYDLSIPIKKWYNEKQLSTEITYIGSETIKPFGKCDVVYSKEWHPNGKIKFEGRQRIINNGNLSVFDPLDFPSIIYNADGSINTRKTKIPNPTFNEVTDDPEEAELIQIEEFFVNNIKSYCYTKIYHKHHNRYMNHGIYMSWFKNGCIYEIINFYKGNKIGNYVKYDSEGRIRKLGVYDIYDGEFRYT